MKSKVMTGAAVTESMTNYYLPHPESTPESEISVSSGETCPMHSPQVPIREMKAFIEDTYQRTGRLLLSPADIDAGNPARIQDTDLIATRKALKWLREFIMRPNPSLGRTGPVCPYVKSAIDESLLYITVAHLKDPEDKQAIYDEMLLYKDILNSMDPKTGPSAALRAFLIIFPETSEAVFSDDPLLMRIKSDFMRQDFTVGRFYPTSDVKSILNAKFFAAQSPVSLFSMRPFLESDWIFIKGEAEWRKIYREKFGEPPAP